MVALPEVSKAISRQGLTLLSYFTDHASEDNINTMIIVN